MHRVCGEPNPRVRPLNGQIRPCNVAAVMPTDQGGPSFQLAFPNYHHTPVSSCTSCQPSHGTRHRSLRFRSARWERSNSGAFPTTERHTGRASRISFTRPTCYVCIDHQHESRATCVLRGLFVLPATALESRPSQPRGPTAAPAPHLLRPRSCRTNACMRRGATCRTCTMLLQRVLTRNPRNPPPRHA